MTRDGHQDIALTALSIPGASVQLPAPSVQVAVATLRTLHARWPHAPLILTPATVQAAPELASRAAVTLPPVREDGQAAQMLDAVETAPGALLCPHASRLWLNLIDEGVTFPPGLSPRYVSAVPDPQRQIASDFRHLLRETVGLDLSHSHLITLLAGDAELSRRYRADPFALDTMTAALDRLALGATGQPWPPHAGPDSEARYLRILRSWARSQSLSR
ncbi:hypothetical protein [Deinococcus petrolearius]|uniref:Uncharacterized protein n=1 Tax=Deinococcus petrolearius TaxID=1751295 RepID=A0ABW1DM09_9DEIO